MKFKFLFLEMLRFLRFALLFYGLFIISLVYIGLYPVFKYYEKGEDNFEGLNKWRRRGLRTWLFFCGIRMDVRFESQIPTTPVIFCPNHFSFLDIPTMALVTGHNVLFMGKYELLKVPIFGFFFRSVDIPVPRASSVGSYRAFEKVKIRLKNGMSPIIFPEGGIKDLMPKMGMFKNGAFRLAIEEKIPIVPVTMVTNQFLMNDSGSKEGMRIGKSFVIMHTPIETKNLTLDDMLPLKQQTFDIINNTLKKYAR
jgi:1-acyl-sn-glycerol-3-phosphate acyltransferase